MVYGTDMVGDELGFSQVGRTLQTDGEGVQARPPGFGNAAVLDTLVGVALGDG